MCMSCHGTGMQVRMHQLLPGMVQQVSTVCVSCQGQGQRISQKDRCKSCGGRKIMRQKKILEVHIDKGRSSSDEGFHLEVQALCPVNITLTEMVRLFVHILKCLHLKSLTSFIKHFKIQHCQSAVHK